MAGDPVHARERFEIFSGQSVTEAVRRRHSKSALGAGGAAVDKWLDWKTGWNKKSNGASKRSKPSWLPSLRARPLLRSVQIVPTPAWTARKRMRGFEKLVKIGMKEIVELRRLQRETDHKLNALIDSQERTEATLRAFMEGLRRGGNGHNGGRTR